MRPPVPAPPPGRRRPVLFAAIAVALATSLAMLREDVGVQGPPAHRSSAPESTAPGPGSPAAACRCPEQTLAAYYDEATEVLLARLDSVGQAVDGRRLHLVVVTPPWKVSQENPHRTVTVGGRVSYRTARSTATCGVQPVLGAVYAVFARPDPTVGGALRVDSCTGTRIHRPVGSDTEPSGFRDTPGRFVTARLDALSGLEVLRAASARAPDPADPTNTSLVGLLDLEPLAHGGVVRVLESPADDAPVLATVSRWEEVDSREVGYEVAAAVVVAHRDGWYRIRLAGGALGWTSSEEAGTWFPYSELPLRRLAYLTDAWSGHVWPGPGAGNPVRSFGAMVSGGGEHPVRVHGSTLVGGVPWFRVEILSETPCGDPGEAVGELSGWVPAYGALGTPTVWYWARGC